MTYVEVAVDAPLGYDRTLTYSVPTGVRLAPGWMVWVPLLARPVQGVVFALADRPQVAEAKVRDVLAAVGPGPLVSPWRLDLARWISRYYRSSLFEAVAPMLPPGYRSRVRSFLHLPDGDGEVFSQLGARAAALASRAATPQGLPERELERALGARGPARVSALVRRGLLRRTWELPHPRVAPRYDCYLRLTAGPGEAAELMDSRISRQQALIDALINDGGPLSLSLARKEYGSAVEALLKRGVLAEDWMRVERRPDMGTASTIDGAVTLTPAQREALSHVSEALANGSDEPRSFLLHGVTGSGKTEVYLRALERCVSQGKQGIFLVPEIALTPQTVHRLNARFPDRVAMLHSGLSAGSLFDQWWRIKEGAYDVVLGPRSALFAPVADLGLIVIDEEHGWTYKQDEIAPRYHARDVALEMARRSGSVVLMGSATPDVVSYRRTQRGDYRLLGLPHRINAPSSNAGPSIEVCDMRRELREGNTGIFSRSLVTALQECMARGEQAILFLNRRGSATVVQCRDCGFSLRCRSCDVALTYHAAYPSLVCHYCGRRSPLPERCPRCQSPRIRYLGLGVQRVAEEAARILPGIPIARWDSDSAATGEAHQRIVESFESGQTRLLVGTQMVAKGLHVPAVSLVGVVLADVGLNLPDFRAGERVFQLLCQVAGRAGRGTVPGRVIIQAYDTGHYAIVSAAGQDYAGFYQREVAYRREQGNPPFGNLVHMVYQHLNQRACRESAQTMGRVLRRRAAVLGLTDVQVVGPAPGYPERVRGRYRWHIILRGGDLHSFLDGVDIPGGWTVDVDPVSAM